MDRALVRTPLRSTQSRVRFAGLYLRPRAPFVVFFVLLAGWIVMVTVTNWSARLDLP